MVPSTDPRTNPFELGMDQFIALDQPHDFAGKEALIAMTKVGISRRFMGFINDGPALAATNEDRLLISFDG